MLSFIYYLDNNFEYYLCTTLSIHNMKISAFFRASVIIIILTSVQMRIIIWFLRNITMVFRQRNIDKIQSWWIHIFLSILTETLFICFSWIIKCNLKTASFRIQNSSLAKYCFFIFLRKKQNAVRNSLITNLTGVLYN